MKTCPRCKEEKQLIEFGTQSMCRPCKSEYNKSWRAKNSEYFAAKKRTDEYKEQQRVYRESRKEQEALRKRNWRSLFPEKHAEHERLRRARKKSLPFDRYSTAEVLDRYGKLCYLCGSEIDLLAPRRVGIDGWENGLHIDHVISIQNGGSDTLKNVRPTHGICNIRKGGENAEY